MKNNIFISVIIPCYNEEDNLKRNVLTSVYDFMKKKNFSWEVIISDDGSTDNSRSLIENQIKEFKNFSYILNAHGGKPLAIFKGIQSAKGKYVLFTDMDQSTPISELDKLLPFIKSGYRVVIGSRGLSRKDFPLYRRIGSVLFMTFRKIFILRDVNDTQCGFKLFSKKTVSLAFPRLEYFRNKKAPRGWKVTSYDVELLHIIKKLGYKVKEVVVDWSSEDVSTTKGGNLSRYFKESKEMFTQVLRVKLNDMNGMYKSNS